MFSRPFLFSPSVRCPTLAALLLAATAALPAVALADDTEQRGGGEANLRLPAFEDLSTRLRWPHPPVPGLGVCASACLGS
jgi:hypothetical protein